MTRHDEIKNAEEMAALYIKAEKAILTNQSYSIGGQTVTRADLDKIRRGRHEWEQKADALRGQSRRSVHRIIVADD